MAEIRMLLLFALSTSISSVVTAQSDSWGDLRIRFTYDGAAPEPPRIADQMGDGFCGDLSLVDESLLVNPVNRGIANVVVYAYEGKGGRELATVHPSVSSGKKKFELANVNCNYVPRVVVMRRGDDLSVVNTDIIGYNAMFGFIANESRNFAVPGKSKKQFVVEEAEPAPVPVECTIYPWMKARLLVLEHRYSAISDRNGVVLIKNLPAGSRVAFRLFHESASFPGLSVAGNVVSRRGVFEASINEGMNDLGAAIISPEVFVQNK